MYSLQNLPTHCPTQVAQKVFNTCCFQSSRRIHFLRHNSSLARSGIGKPRDQSSLVSRGCCHCETDYESGSPALNFIFRLPWPLTRILDKNIRLCLVCFVAGVFRFRKLNFGDRSVLIFQFLKSSACWEMNTSCRELELNHWSSSLEGVSQQHTWTTEGIRRLQPNVLFHRTK